jgi:uncharacterized protein YuzE
MEASDRSDFVQLPFTVTVDDEVDAASIYFGRGSNEGGFSHMIDEPNAAGTIILDFDSEGRLTSIEILGASQTLTEDLLRRHAEARAKASQQEEAG